MLKETMICLVIIIGVFVLNNLAEKYTEETTKAIEERLSNLKVNLESMEEEQEAQSLKEELDSIYDEWKSYYKYLSYYVDHGELGKIDLNLISAKSLIDSGEFNVAMSEVEMCIYELKYMQSRYELNISNIF